MLLGNVKVNDL